MSVTPELLCVKQVFPELVTQVYIYFFESAFAVNEVVEVLIDKSPFPVSYTHLDVYKRQHKLDRELETFGLEFFFTTETNWLNKIRFAVDDS